MDIDTNRMTKTLRNIGNVKQLLSGSTDEREHTENSTSIVPPDLPVHVDIQSRSDTAKAHIKSNGVATKDHIKIKGVSGFFPESGSNASCTAVNGKVTMDTDTTAATLETRTTGDNLEYMYQTNRDGKTDATCSYIADRPAIIDDTLKLLKTLDIEEENTYVKMPFKCDKFTVEEDHTVLTSSLITNGALTKDVNTTSMPNDRQTVQFRSNVRTFDVTNNARIVSKVPSNTFTSWRALVYYCNEKSEEDKKDGRASGSVRAVQRHRKTLNAANLNNSLTMDVDVDNDLQCPICLELYTYPIILPCSHVLCRSPCAEHLFDFNFIRCPVCRDNCYVSGGIGSLPRVIALENIIDRYKNERKKEKTETTASKPVCSKQTVQSSPSVPTGASLSAALPSSSSRTETDIKCQHCKNGVQRRAKKFCITCGSHFCASCMRLNHPNKEPFTSHEFTEPTAARSSSSSSKGSTSATNKNPSGTLVPGTNRTIVDSYCRLCTQPFCSNSDEGPVHSTHSAIPIEQAYREYKNNITDSSDKLSTSQSKVVTSLKNLKDRLKNTQHALSRRRDDINMQCDGLLAEIENKRSYFLADLDYEERIQQTSMEDNIKMMEKTLGASQGLQAYVNDMLAADKPQFMEIANTLNERLVKATLDCAGASVTVPPDADGLQNKVVDCRREKVLLRELAYLSPPSTPIIDVTRCSRSENAVVLALCPPSNVHEVVDQYEVHFCSEEQKNIELEETQIVKNFAEDSCCSSTTLSANSSGIVVVLLENLCRATTYYFCLSASNAAGKSTGSEVVQCTTMGVDESVIPVPVIVESLCKRFTSSIQIFTSSPTDVAAEQKISHFLLYRQPGHSATWRCVSLYGREEQRVFGLEPATEYEFQILAYNLRGECQLSNKVAMATESGANY